MSLCEDFGTESKLLLDELQSKTRKRRETVLSTDQDISFDLNLDGAAHFSREGFNRQTHHQSRQSRDEGTCYQHSSKKIEVFCDECKELMCIDCILTQKHRNHEILSLDKGVEKERELVQRVS